MEKTLQAVLAGLDRSRFQPHLCVFSLTGQESRVVPPDVPLHFLAAGPGPASPSLAFKLWLLLRELRPDKLFSFAWGVNLVALTAGNAAGVPVIVNEATVTSENIKEYSFPGLRRAAIRALYPRAEAVVAISDFVRNDLLSGFGIPAAKLLTIHNGIDAAAVRKESLAPAPAEGGYIFACGSLTPIKNHALLVEAAAGLDGARLVIAGRGPLERELSALARERGVSLSLPGYLENPFPFFRAAAVFAHTSLYEGFGNVILEAMACGVPVVAADCPGAAREIIAHGRTGLLVPAGDPAALRGALRLLLEDRGLAAGLAAGAAGLAEERFSFARMLERYSELLER